MNCKFCGNFVPDGNDTCPVCGRRPTEDPIGKLLSENQPSTLVAVPSAESKAPAKEPKKGLFAPLLAIAASVGSWIYAWGQGIWDTIRTIFNGSYGASSQLGADSSFATGASSTSAFGEASTGVILLLAAAVLITIIGVAGVIALFKRLFNRIKY